MARSVQQGGPFAFCGIAVAGGRGKGHYFTACADGIEADEGSVFRVASLSKIVTAAVFEGAAAGAGLARPFGQDAAEVLGLDLRHPRFPTTPVTLGMLMTHTAGLSDLGGYVFDGSIADNWNVDIMFGTHQPGTFFEYSNLGYVLLAAAAERLSGKRFDSLVADALKTRGLSGGFNWCGLDEAACARALPTFRWDGRRFLPMIDAPGPTRFEPGPSYELGRDTARFSPQGGMRMSLRSMLGLAQVGAGVTRDPFWRATDGPGEYLDGLMQDYGAGEQILPDPPFYPRSLVGHFGNAYGFKGGTWWDTEADICFAYALNGAAVGDESDALSPAELQIFEAISQAL